MTIIPGPSEDYVVVEEEFDQGLPGVMTDIPPGPAIEYHHYGRRKSLVKWNQMIKWIFYALEIVLGFRVMLKLIAANPLIPFTQFIYHLTEPFVAPFSGLTVTPDVSGAVLEISSIIGMIAYAVLYWLIVRLIWIVFNPARPSDASRYEPDL